LPQPPDPTVPFSGPVGQPTYVELAAENELLRSRLTEFAKRLEEIEAANLALTADIVRLRAGIGMNSQNSSKPPSTDGYAKPAPKSRRRRSGTTPGKQPGTPGTHLPPVADPDEIIDHNPDHCEPCGDDLSDAPVAGEVRRQVFDLPPVVVATVEHRAKRKRCSCGHETTAPFPPEATGPTCDGSTCYRPKQRALVRYLVVRADRTSATLVAKRAQGLAICRPSVADNRELTG